MYTQMPEPVVPPTLPPVIDPPPGDDVPPLPEHDPDEPDRPEPLKVFRNLSYYRK